MFELFAALHFYLTAPTYKTATVSYYECCNAKTAAGIAFNPEMPGVAHKSLPFNTLIEFKSDTGTITVPVIDRGPFIKGREFDLTRGSARKLGILKAGVADIKYRIVSLGSI